MNTPLYELEGAQQSLNSAYSGGGVTQFSEFPSNRALWQRRAFAVSQFILTSQLKAWLVVISVAILSFSVIRIYWVGSHKGRLAASTSTANNNGNAQKVIKLRSVIIQEVACTIALSIAWQSAFKSGHWAEAIALSYVFTLGVLQFAYWSTRYCAVINRHMNALVATLTALITVQYLLPAAIFESPVTIATLDIIKLLCLVIFCFVWLNSPRSIRSKEPSQENLILEVSQEGSPEETCSWWSRHFSYEWLTPLIIKGFLRDLDMEDLPPLPAYDSPVILLDRMRETRPKRGKMLFTLLRVFQRDIIIVLLWSILLGLVEYIAPLAMFYLLRYLANPEESTAVINPFIWIGLLFLGPMIRSVCFQGAIFKSTRLLVLVKAAVIQDIYQTTLTSRIDNSIATSKKDDISADMSANGTEIPENAAKPPTNPITAKIESLVSYDADMIANAGDIIEALATAAVSTIVAVVFLYQLLGWPSLAGVAVLMLLSPLPARFSNRISEMHRLVMEVMDVRLSLIAEYLSSIRPLKLFGWETIISNQIEKVRTEEQSRIWRRNIVSMFIMMTGDLLSLISLVVMFAVFVAFTDRPFLAPIAFTSLSITEMLRAHFIWLSKVIQWVAQGWQSLQRVDDYLDAAVMVQRHPSGPPAFNNAAFCVAEHASFRLKNISINFKEKALNVVNGPTASGKTSLLLSLLGETILESGSATCPPDVAFVPQTAWLQNDSIRGNILFYGLFDESRYNKVLYACDLYKDLEQLPKGEGTHVGEQGSSLSGGQKQRISLARALYSNASLLLLDDVFSALDAHTASTVYERCFCSGLLSDRTVILVTYFSRAIEDAELCVRLEHGTVESIRAEPIRKKTDLQAHKPDTTEDLTSSESSLSVESSSPNEEMPGTSRTEVAEPRSELQEKRASGRVPRILIAKYLLLFGGWPYAVLAIASALLVQFSNFSITLWLSYWTDEVAKQVNSSQTPVYLIIYIGLVVTFISLQTMNNFIYQTGGWKAANIMHKRLVTAVLSAPITWFDVHPIGQALNRFGPDIQSMDSLLVYWFRMTLDNALRLILRLASIASIMPIFALPASIICLFGFGTGEVYTRAQISVKRLCSVSFSPIISHFNDTASGLAIIRARYLMDNTFQQLLSGKVATNMRAFEAQYNCNRWVSIRSDLCAAIIAATAGCIAFYKSGSAGLVGFSLTNAIGLSQTILILVRNMNELEVELNSFQRISEYTEIEPEEKEDAVAQLQKADLPASWPSSGRVEFCDVTVRYSQNGPDILRNLSFSIKPGERVAIVGRTGSGKSTLAQTILRATRVVSGQVLIDGVDTSNLSLAQLRQSLSFVPQDPVLFTGDLKSNLDPSDDLDSTELRSILSACNAMQPGAEQNIRNSEIDLTADTKVASAGKNFSQGQKQILGLARAMCRRSKVVILDEATASVDLKTDARMQQLIRSEFPGSTVITIAHRLKTIIDYDRIIVLDAGQILEMGSPTDLIEKRAAFWHMLQNVDRTVTTP